MTRTCAYVTTFESLINRAPETGGSETVFRPGVHVSKFDCEDDWYAARNGLHVLEMLWDSVAHGTVTDRETIHAALYSVYTTLSDAHSRLGKTLMLTGSEKTEADLAAPFSFVSAAAAPGDDDADWPEWPEWLATVNAFLELCRATEQRPHADDDQEEDDDRRSEELLSRLDALEDAMMARPALTERQRAIATAIYVWHTDISAGHNNFDLRGMDGWSSGPIERWMVLGLCRHAAAVLPEVPFVFPAKA